MKQKISISSALWQISIYKACMLSFITVTVTTELALPFFLACIPLDEVERSTNLVDPGELTQQLSAWGPLLPFWWLWATPTPCYSYTGNNRGRWASCVTVSLCSKKNDFWNLQMWLGHRTSKTEDLSRCFDLHSRNQVQEVENKNGAMNC